MHTPCRYEEGKLIDAEGEAVMMGWEAPLMERHAAIICRQVTERVLGWAGRD